MSDVAGLIRDPIETWAKLKLVPWIALEYDGVTYEPEDSAGALREFWARLTILYGDAFEETMGPEDVGHNRITGVAVLDVFGEPGKGTGPLTKKADEARAVFNRITLDGIEFGPTSGPSAPRVEREGWLMVSLRTPFAAFEVH